MVQVLVRQVLDLRYRGTGDPRRTSGHLFPGDVRRLVGLCMGSERDVGRRRRVRHVFDVPVEGFE